jgi:nicotinamidase-related amidase
MTVPPIYAEPQNPALPPSGFVLDLAHAALVITDPQIDFLSPDGASWPVFGDSIRENNTVAHIGELLHAAKQAGITVAVSPHYFYPTDKQWVFGDPLEKFMSSVGMFGRQGAYTTNGFAGSGADFLPDYQHHIHDGQTVIASPHKIVGPESNDLVLQLRKRGVNQVILAGMAANLCVEGHMRERRAGIRSRRGQRCHGRSAAARRRRLPGRVGELSIPRQRGVDHSRSARPSQGR